VKHCFHLKPDPECEEVADSTRRYAERLKAAGGDPLGRYSVDVDMMFWCPSRVEVCCRCSFVKRGLFAGLSRNCEPPAKKAARELIESTAGVRS
jgi:hypothetical protein